MKKFQTPYLRMDNPADLKKVKTILAKCKKDSLTKSLNENKSTELKVHKDLKNFTKKVFDKQLDLNPVILDNKAINKNIATKLNTQEATLPSQELHLTVKNRMTIVSTEVPNSANRVAGAPITTSPSGQIELGYNCQIDLNVSLDNFPGDYFHWYIFFKDSNGNFVGMPQYIGTTSENECIIPLDQTTYYLQSFIQTGYATFKLFCGIDLNGVSYPALALSSDEITLHFSQQACVGIYSARITPDKFQGGRSDTDKAVKFTINLDAPAPPGGQLVTLSLTCANDLKPIARFVEGNTFTVPAGLQSESLSFFLGTKKAKKSDKTFDLIAKVNGSVSYTNVVIEEG